jgi:type II secretory pathway component HofQ
MYQSFLRLALVAVPGVLLLSVPGVQSAPTTKSEVKSASSVEQIKKALETSTNIDFANQPLPSVLTALGEECKITIVLDRVAIQSSGMEPNEMMVDIHLKNTKLRSGLRTLLNQYNLSYGIVGDQLFVSTEETVIARQLKQRINVEVDNVPLSKMMKDLAKEYGINIVIDPRSIKEKKSDEPVTLSLEDVPFETVVRLACEIGSLKPVRMGNVLFVTSEARAEKLRDQDLAPPTNPGGFPGILNPNLGGLGIAQPAIPIAPNPPPQPVVEEKKD